MPDKETKKYIDDSIKKLQNQFDSGSRSPGFNEDITGGGHGTIKKDGKRHNVADYILGRLGVTTKFLKLLEQSDDEVDIAGYGQVWIKDDVPNILMYTDDAGNQFSISAGVQRSMNIEIRDGGTPGTNLQCAESTQRNFNAPSSTNATTLAKSGTEGSWSLSADGTVITLDLTEDVIGILNVGVMYNDLADGAGNTYMVIAEVSGNNILFTLTVAGSTSNIDWTTVTATASDAILFNISFITST